MSKYFSIDNRILTLSGEAEQACAGAYAEIDRIAEENSHRVLEAFHHHRVSEAHLQGTTGYGYGDRGRDTLDKVFARITGAQDALVRHSFVCGTSAITTALFGVLRPGDTLVSLSGTPYDTLHAVLGLGEQGIGSLRDFGVTYRELALLPGGRVDKAAVPQAVQGAKVAYLQRSRGYHLRPPLTVLEIGEITRMVKQANPGVIVMVDNCYGEFVEVMEPTGCGADLMMGSLIKNPGGGIARTGGYIAGRGDLIELCAHRMTCPGLGREVGCTLEENKNMYLGLFYAPTVVASALKTAVFAAALLECLGFEVLPKPLETRADIIQAVVLGSAQGLSAFCRGIQRGAPIDSFVTPEAWQMPGYDNKVIMAAGAFHMGASIELSADGPMREPYAAFLQGGLTYPSGKLGVQLAAQCLLDSRLLRL